MPDEESLYNFLSYLKNNEQFLRLLENQLTISAAAWKSMKAKTYRKNFLQTVKDFVVVLIRRDDKMNFSFHQGKCLLTRRQ